MPGPYTLQYLSRQSDHSFLAVNIEEHRSLLCFFFVFMNSQVTGLTILTVSEWV